ncbi:aminotransferase class I/II-fold pyridoxal phosphate-dependent enzyme [Archangium violaceum]|uniref:aminotransferase class I/II-fold pyridoxal phosphate-dependent enzyme n=1 Tax=Archangium violaceum TaxID=83451 RepID=UPI0036DC8EA1
MTSRDPYQQLIENKFQRYNALADLAAGDTMLYKVATEQKGRQVRVDGKWVTDFASCNYLGLDLHEEVIASIPEMLRKWGVHPSWSKAVMQPEPYLEMEARLAELIGVENVFVIPTATLIHHGLIPALTMKESLVLVDRHAHNSVQTGCAIAKARGATVETFRHNDMEDLEARLRQSGDEPSRLICVDGVYSPNGAFANVPELVALARKYGAILYIDDAHGFGIIGEDPSPEHPYGRKGNGIVQHLGQTYDNVIYVGALSKAYSSMAAFMSCPARLKDYLKLHIDTYVYSGPVPTAAFASTLAALEVNRTQGEQIRRKLFHLTKRMVDGLRELGMAPDTANYFPIVATPFGKDADAQEVARILMEEGIYVTLMLFPAIARNKGIIRATVTAENTEEEVEQFLRAMKRVRDRDGGIRGAA